MTPSRRGRFIAGAVCPACGELDRLLVEARSDNPADDDRQRRCVACGHVDSLESTASQAPTTRLDGALGDDEVQDVQPVRILKPD